MRRHGHSPAAAAAGAGGGGVIINHLSFIRAVRTRPLLVLCSVKPMLSIFYNNPSLLFYNTFRKR